LFIHGIPVVAVVFIFAVLALLGREVGGRLAVNTLASEPYSQSDWEHLRVLAARLVELGVKPELARREASRILSETTDYDLLRSVKYLRQQLPENVYVQPKTDDALSSKSTGIISASDTVKQPS
jgi:hypothetical protein